MNKLLCEIDDLTEKELTRANADYPLFASEHEGYAILLEELEEAELDMIALEKVLNRMWQLIKRNEKSKAQAEIVMGYAKHMAAESVQVAAMAQKYIDSSMEE